MTNQETYRRLRALGFSAEQALAEMDGAADDTYDNAVVARRTVAEPTPEPAMLVASRAIKVAVPKARRRTTRGPMFEYFARPVRKGAKVTISAGNNTDVYKALAKGKPLSVPQIAQATGISPHSVESSVYQLRTAGLIDKQPIER